jgi:hypothetical protein
MPLATHTRRKGHQEENALPKTVQVTQRVPFCTGMYLVVGPWTYTDP